MEARLFPAGTVPEHTTPDWYAERETAPHLEQAGHQERLRLAAQYVGMVTTPGEGTVVDLGAGDGGLLSLLDVWQCWGYDLQQSNVEAANIRGVAIHYGDVLEFPIPEVDVIVVTEMLEHLVDPHGLLARIHASGSRWLVASSPYTETADSHYAFHTWAWDQRGYLDMIEAAGYRIVASSTAWICSVVLAERVA